MKKKKIEPLEIVLQKIPRGEMEEKYTQERLSYIAEYEIHVPGFWGGQTKKSPESGEAEWNSMHPKGFATWESRKGRILSSYGMQTVIDKLNEVIEHINKKK